MPSPLMRGEYYLRPKPAGTKEEVLARMKEIILGNMNQPANCDVMPWHERMEAKLIQRRAREIWDDNYKASFLPDWICVGPQKPFGDRTDQRYLNYTGRYGHTRSD